MKSSIQEIALRYVARKERSEKEVRDYLIRREFASDAIELVIEKLKGWKYLDDHRVSESIARSVTRSGYGPRRVQMRLKNRGLNPALNSLASQPALQEDVLIEGRDRLFEAIRRRYPERNRNPAEKQKALGFLVRRGFSFSESLKILQQADLSENQSSD